MPNANKQAVLTASDAVLIKCVSRTLEQHEDGDGIETMARTSRQRFDGSKIEDFAKLGLQAHQHGV